jgi:hypothetical protein
VQTWSQRSDSQGVFALLLGPEEGQQGGEEGRACSLARGWEAVRRGSAAQVVFCVKDVHGAFQLPAAGAASAGGDVAGSNEAGEALYTYTPGWGVRNVLALLAHSLPPASTVRVLCVQSQRPPGQAGQLCYPLLTVHLPAHCLQAPDDPPTPPASSGCSARMPRVVGWQANERGKPGPRVLDAAIVMDTRRIMEQVNA